MIIDSIFSQSMDDRLFWQKTKSVELMVACWGEIRMKIMFRYLLLSGYVVPDYLSKAVDRSLSDHFFHGKGYLKKEGTGHGEKK